MKKGPKGPHTDKAVLGRLIDLALHEPPLLGKEIRDTLEQEFGFIKTPGLRTVQHYMVKAREQAKDNVGEQPWSLGIMQKADTGIPWEAVPFLLDCYRWFSQELFRIKNRAALFAQLLQQRNIREPLEREAATLINRHVFPVSDLPEAQRKLIPKRVQWLVENLERYEGGFPPLVTDLACHMGILEKGDQWVIMTNRRAKWLWRMHQFLPSLTIPNDLLLLSLVADTYAVLEFISEYQGHEFDTSVLDRWLTQLRRLSEEQTDKARSEEKMKG